MGKIPSTRRREINDYYWGLKDYDLMQCFIRENVKQVPLKKRKRGNDLDPKKMWSYNYFLKDDQGIMQPVCQTFFINTLGYSINSSSFIYRAFGIEDSNVPDRRGKYIRKNNFDEDIKNDIMAYHPQISHYRRQNSPNALYLPSDVTFKGMVELYKAKCEDEKKTPASKSKYYKVLKKMNVRFSSWKQEECEACTEFAIHEKTVGHTRDSLQDIDSIECLECLKWFDHRQRYRQAREMYTTLKETQLLGHLFTAADLQKV